MPASVPNATPASLARKRFAEYASGFNSRFLRGVWTIPTQAVQIHIRAGRRRGVVVVVAWVETHGRCGLEQAVTGLAAFR
jgi:hypothetical protein